MGMGWFEKVREAGGWRLVCQDLAHRGANAEAG